MQKHLTVVAILNIVYRVFGLLGAVVLFFLGLLFADFMGILMSMGHVSPHDVPVELFEFMPLIMWPIALLLVIDSAAGIIGAVGVLKKREWARVLLLVVSFFSLVRVPLGTLLGAYGIWVLMNDGTIKLFNPAVQAPGSPAVPSTV